MYYRYEGAWLSEVIGDLYDLDMVAAIKISDQYGAVTEISKDEIDKCFLAIGNTQSINRLDAMEEERVSISYKLAKVIMPETGVSIYSSSDDYAPEGQNVGILVDGVIGLQISYSSIEINEEEENETEGEDDGLSVDEGIDLLVNVDENRPNDVHKDGNVEISADVVGQISTGQSDVD
jgi:hypothetical protein